MSANTIIIIINLKPFCKSQEEVFYKFLFIEKCKQLSLCTNLLSIHRLKSFLHIIE
jgi:hypothetical protein